MTNLERFAVGIAIGLTARHFIAAWSRRRRGRRYLRQFRDRMIADFHNLVSQAMLSARPEVPPTWREMVAVETAELPCDCPRCVRREADARKGLS